MTILRYYGTLIDTYTDYIKHYIVSCSVDVAVSGTIPDTVGELSAIQEHHEQHNLFIHTCAMIVCLTLLY